MKTKNIRVYLRNKNIVRIVLVTAVVLMVPLVAMQFTDEVQWDQRDFIVIGTLLIGTGLTYELAVKKIKNPMHRIVLATVLFVALLLIWMDLAVGIFKTPPSGS